MDEEVIWEEEAADVVEEEAEEEGVGVLEEEEAVVDLVRRRMVQLRHSLETKLHSIKRQTTDWSGYFVWGLGG